MYPATNFQADKINMRLNLPQMLYSKIDTDLVCKFTFPQEMTQDAKLSPLCFEFQEKDNKPLTANSIIWESALILKIVIPNQNTKPHTLYCTYRQSAHVLLTADGSKYQDFYNCEMSTPPSTYFVNETECIQCGTCFACCPYNALIVKDDGYPFINPDVCLFCGICADTCPSSAIIKIE